MVPGRMEGKEKEADLFCPELYIICCSCVCACVRVNMYMFIKPAALNEFAADTERHLPVTPSRWPFLTLCPHSVMVLAARPCNSPFMRLFFLQSGG